MKQGMALDLVYAETKRQSVNQRDLVVRGNVMSYDSVTDVNGRLQIAAGTTIEQYGISPFARGQLAKICDIPHKYFERMRNNKPALLDQNVNTWLTDLGNDTKLVRTMDGDVRAMLSNRYRIVDNRMLLEYLFPVLNDMGLELEFTSLNLSEKCLYIKFVSKRLETDLQVNDPVQVGVVITNSEVGYRKLSVSTLLYRLFCLNGFIMPDVGLSKNHVGRILESDELPANLLSREAIEADNFALMLKVRDAVKYSLTEAMLQKLAERLRSMLKIPIKGDPVAAVQVLSNRYKLDDEECSGVLGKLIRSPDMSAFGLVNAVTAYAQDVDDYDRSTELEQVGGAMLLLTAEAWKPIVEAKPSQKKGRQMALAA